MPKRQRSDRNDGRKPAKRRLYLVMNDGDLYAVRKFNLSSYHHHTGGDDAERLPPALVRFEHGYFAAVGTSIMVMESKRPNHVVPVFDVATRRVSVGPQHNSSPSQLIYIPVGGDKLVALDDDSWNCKLMSLGSDGRTYSWSKLGPPFNLYDIVSHAVHPDGRTVSVSVHAVTLSLDTGSKKWRCHGNWKLPFAGRAHYDPVLDAWIGLSGDPDTLGFLCCCDVVSTDGLYTGEPLAKAGETKPPAWKLSKDRLFGENLAEKHVGASLVYLGLKSFCLVHYFIVKDVGMLRLTTFSLAYDKKGDLRTLPPHRVRCYQLPVQSYIHTFRDPVAFWL